MIRRLLLAAALALALVAPSVADPASNQLASWSALCTGITEGVFTASSGTPSQCTSSPNRIITWANFVGAVTNSGCPSGNPLPYWQQMINCRVNGSPTVNPTTDPWLILGATDWPNTGGSFAALGSGVISGSPAGAQYFTSTSSTGSIQQTLAPASIASGTVITVAAFFYRQQDLFNGFSDSACHNSTAAEATSTAVISIYESGGALVSSTAAPITTGFVQAGLSGTAPVTGGYYVKVAVTPDFASYTFYVRDVHGACTATSGELSAFAEVTDITAS